jgi:hypothetical protein
MTLKSSLIQAREQRIWTEVWKGDLVQIKCYKLIIKLGVTPLAKKTQGVLYKTPISGLLLLDARQTLDRESGQNMLSATHSVNDEFNFVPCLENTNLKRKWRRTDSGYSSLIGTEFSADSSDMLWNPLLEVADESALFSFGFQVASIFSIEKLASNVPGANSISTKDDEREMEIPIDDTPAQRNTGLSLASMTGLLDAAVRLSIREPAIYERVNQQPGLKIKGSSFQQRLSGAFPGIWSPGYLMVEATHLILLY